MHGTWLRYSPLVLVLACSPADGERTRTMGAALAAQVEEESATRRVWARAGDYASPSPDGRYATFVDWSSGDVAMHDLETGEDVRLTDKGEWIENGSWAEEPLFSPDGRHVAFAYGNVRYTGDQRGGWRYELHMVEVGDTRQHMIYALEPDDLWLGPFDWSETHGIVAEINRADRTVDYSLIDPATGEIEVLEVIPEGEEHPHEAFFSPDERYLADRRGNRLHLRDLREDDATVLDLPVKRLLGWVPDGGALLVHTERNAEAGIWALPVDDLAVDGKPILVQAGLPGVLPSGRAGEQMFYVLVVDTPKLFRAAIDAPAGRVLAQPVSLTSMADGLTSRPTWSPDGASLAYAYADPLEQSTRIMLMATDGDAVRELVRLDSRWNAIRDLTWTDDGQSLVLIALRERKHVLFEIDVQSGALTRLAEANWLGFDFALLGDGDTVVYVRDAAQGDGQPPVLIARSMTDGGERRIADLPPNRGVSAVVVAPDGSEVAIQYRDYSRSDATGIMLVSTDDGHIQDLYEERQPRRVAPSPLAWTPDGRHIVAARGRWDDEESRELISISVETGEIVPLMQGIDQWRSLEFHPDGRRLSFVAGELQKELWVIDEVPDAVATARSKATR